MQQLKSPDSFLSYRAVHGFFVWGLMLMITLFHFTVQSHAQSVSRNDMRTINGRVTEKAGGAALGGVTIQLKGTSTSVVSDNAGNFSLQAPGNGILVFSYVGYGSVEEEINNRTNITLELDRGGSTLNDVVVVGYGTQSKRDVTGSVASVSAKQLQDRAVVSFGEALAGQMAGVQVQQTSAAPGGGLSLRIRGTGSITAGNQPLYVVDGVPLDNAVSTASAQGGDIGDQSPVNPLASINPGDIQSIDVLKDASATSIYGSRGSNGVVLITTKQGVAGRSQITLNASYGFQDIAKKIPIMTNQEYARRQIDMRNANWVRTGGNENDPNDVRSGPAFKIPEEFLNAAAQPYTDWQDLLYQRAPMSNYQLAASGGTENMRYYISGNYQNQEGLVINSGF